MTDDPLSLELVPVKELSERMAMGWQMLPDYPLHANDWAVIMAPPNAPVELRTNRSRAGTSRSYVRETNSRPKPNTATRACLADEQVNAIRQSSLSKNATAKQHGVTWVVVDRIQRGEAYKWVEPA